MARVLISAIDASGDAHAAQWVEALREIRPGAYVFGAGGSALEKAGADVRVNLRELAVAGVVEALEIVPAVWRAWRKLERTALIERAELAVLVDAPDFHLPLARRLKRHGIPVLGYIGPNVHRWRRKRVHKVAARLDRLASIFPYEPPHYAETKLDVTYVGHPLVDPVQRYAERWDRAAARTVLELSDETRAVALFPGSRRNELRAMLPLFLDAATQLNRDEPGLQFLLGVAPSMDRRDIEARVKAHAPKLPLRILENQSHTLLRGADVALAKPGTITMESALLDCPLVVAGRAHPLTAAVWRRMVIEPSFALPNIVAGETIVPEFLQRDATPKALAAALRTLLDGPERRRQLDGFTRVRSRLGPGGAAERTAALASAMLERTRPL